MDPISNVDRLVLLLRQRLQERSKAAAAGRATQTSAAEREATSAPEGLEGLAALDQVGDRQLGRALVQRLLADEFGPALINEARFQQVVDRVTEAIEDDSDGAALLARAAAMLRAGAR